MKLSEIVNEMKASKEPGEKVQASLLVDRKQAKEIVDEVIRLGWTKSNWVVDFEDFKKKMLILTPERDRLKLVLRDED
jgi:hypothetical protein